MVKSYILSLFLYHDMAAKKFEVTHFNYFVSLSFYMIFILEKVISS